MPELRPELPAPPPRIAKLPVDARGYPVPWFVAWVADDGVTPASPEEGTPDFRVIAPGRIDDAVRFRRCWICGQTLGGNVAYVIGPMCAVNRVSAEPPSHRDCALYAAVACPFLTRPNMKRNDHGPVPAGVAEELPGIPLKRNPGLALVWVTKGVRRAPHGLFNVGNPTEVYWVAEGRTATRQEVEASVLSGLPALEEIAAKQGPLELKRLARQVEDARALFPPLEAA